MTRQQFETLTPVEIAILTAGNAYNNTMGLFGDYRFSDTIEAAYGGEPAWLQWLHATYSEAKGGD